MSKKIENQEEIVVAEAVSKTEKFFEQNGKKVIIALVAFVLVFAGVFGFKVFILDKNEAAAAELMLVAQERLDGETPNYELALNGDESGAGFLEVIEQYGSTKAGNLAKHYAGTCYLRLGKFEEAAKALAELVSDDELNPEYVIPKAFDPRVGGAVAAAVAQAARDSGVARI